MARKIAGIFKLTADCVVWFLQRIDNRLPLVWKKAIFLGLITAWSAWCSYTFFSAVTPASKSPPASARHNAIEKQHTNKK